VGDAREWVRDDVSDAQATPGLEPPPSRAVSMRRVRVRVGWWIAPSVRSSVGLYEHVHSIGLERVFPAEFFGDLVERTRDRPCCRHVASSAATPSDCRTATDAASSSRATQVVSGILMRADQTRGSEKTLAAKWSAKGTQTAKSARQSERPKASERQSELLASIELSTLSRDVHRHFVHLHQHELARARERRSSLAKTLGAKTVSRRSLSGSSLIHRSYEALPEALCEASAEGSVGLEDASSEPSEALRDSDGDGGEGSLAGGATRAHI